MSNQANGWGQLFAELTVHNSRESIKRTLAAVRDELGIDVVYLSRQASETGCDQVFPLADPRTRQPLSLPLRFSDGWLYGSLECRARGGAPLSDRDAVFMRVVAQVVSEQLEREQLDLDEHRARSESMGLSALLAAVEARDSYTGQHCRSVVDLSVRVAHSLGLSPRELEQVEQVALLHDVGKVAVPDGLLGKRGPLDELEREIVERHTVTGAQIVRSIPGLAHLAPAIRAGHERWDGRGYPDGLSGESIPLISRITFVCDAYDAMTSDRPYRRALGPLRAREEVRMHAGTQFCERAAAGLLSALAGIDGPLTETGFLPEAAST